MSHTQDFSQFLNYRFTPDHSWIEAEGDLPAAGITDYAQDSLGEIVFIDSPKVGSTVRQGNSVSEIESVKAVADIGSPVGGTIKAINEDLQDHPELCNEDPYGDGWLVKIQPHYAEARDALHTFITYQSEILNEVEHVFFLDGANRIRHFPAVRVPSGLLASHSGEIPAFLATGLVNAQHSQRLELADEFEDLINDPRVTELAIQRFLELHPAFLLGNEYSELHSQVVLQREGQGSLRPDFLLRPLAGVSQEAQIVDLKLPQQNVVRQVPNRPHLYANVTEAVSQLRTYARYFEEQANRAFIMESLGFTAFVPRVTLVVGRSIELDPTGNAARALADARPVEIVTYTDVLTRYRRLVDPETGA
jgi:glycine cleavage system H protein